MLKAAGFDVVVKADLGLRAMQRALRDLSEKAQGADVAVVFYAGHGIEVGGVNYLVPVDAALERDLDVEDEAVRLDRVTQMIENAKRLRLVMLDACRDNPFAQAMKVTAASRSIGRGLARVDEVASDTLIAFSAKHGSIALDGVSLNSPFREALVKHLATPGLDLRQALGRVRDEVRKSTGNRQEPYVYGSLGGDLVALVPATTGVPLAAPKLPPSPPPAPALREAVSEWQRVDKSSIPELETFIRRNPTSPEADYARAHLEGLRKKQASLAKPEPPLAKPAPPVPDLRTFSDPLAERDRLAAELSYKRFARASLAHLDCDTLWYLRNSIFARHGYRFKTARGQRVFGTGGRVDNPRLSAVEESNVTEIRAVEGMKACPR
jgi:hypothetical protein